MKYRFKKLITIIILVAMLLNVTAPTALALVESQEPYIIQNGIVEYRINKDDGRFTIHTVDGIPNKASDNDLNLLFYNKMPETSFTTFRIDGEDYIFGNNYGLKGGVVYSTVIDGYMAKTVWSIKDVEVTQKILLISDPSNPNVGNTKITYEVANGSGSTVSVGSRILLDTQLGSNDASPIIIGSSYITNETEYTGENIPISWKSADEKFAPNVIAYGLLSGWGNIKPDRMVISHWESISQTAWDFEPDPLVNFTTTKNAFQSADSAVGLYFNPAPLETGETRVYETYYGIGSLSDAFGDGKFNLQLTSPQKLTVNESKTGYNEESINITVNIDNSGIESTDLNNIVVKLGLSDELKISPNDAMIKTINSLEQGETTSISFNVIPTVQQNLTVAEYGITVVYGDDGSYSEAKKFIILPSIKGTPPKMQMTEIAPAKIYTGSNKKSVVIKGSEFSSLKADYEWKMVITNIRTGVSQEISRSNIYISDATLTIQLDSLKFESGEYEISLLSKNYGNMSKTITMTDDKRYDRMEYGVLLIGAFGSYNTEEPVYTIKVLEKEEDIENLSPEDKEAILFTIRGEISSYELSGVTVYECESGTIINNAIMYTAPKSKPESTMIICRYEGVNGWSGADSFFDNFEWFGKDNDSLLISGEGTLSIGDYKFHYGDFYVTLEDGVVYELGEADDDDYNRDINENVGEVDREEVSPVQIITPANVIANEVFKPLGELSGVKINISNAVINKNTVSLGGSFSVALPWLPGGDDEEGSDSKASDSFDKINAINDYQGADSLVALNMEEMRYGINADDNTSTLVGVKAEGSINLTDDTLPMLDAGGAKAGFKINSIDYPGWFAEISAGVKVASAFECEALVSLVFETGGECIPDSIELVIGGDVVKIPLGVAPLQVGWLNKLGGGVYNLYDTIKGNFNAIPPVALKVITGYEDPTTVALELDTVSMQISLGGIKFEAEEGKIVKLPLLDYMYAGFQIYDTEYNGIIYPCIDIGAGIRLNLLDIVIGEGSIWLVSDPRIDGIFGNLSIGGKLYCGVFIPKAIPLVGGLELAAVMAELSSYRVYAGVRVIGIPLSIAYYWADKKVKFNDSWELANELNIPIDDINNSLAIEINENETNAAGVMVFGGNLRKTYCSADEISVASNNRLLLASLNDMSEPLTKYTYEFDMKNQSYGLIQLEYEEDLPNITIKDPSGNNYELIENENFIIQKIDANESKSGLDEQYVFISVTDPMNGKWTVETDKQVIVTAMDVLELPELQDVTCEKLGDGKLKVNWNALNIDDDYTVDIHISKEQVIDQELSDDLTDEQLQELYKEMADSYDVGVCVLQDVPASQKSAIVDISERLEGGNYQARVVLKKNGENYDSKLSSNTFKYVNPNTPEEVRNLVAVPGGDGQFKVSFEGVGDSTGYYILVLDENGNPIDGFDGIKTKDTTAYVGYTYKRAKENTAYDADGKPLDFETVGVIPGKKYKIQVYSYNEKDSTMYMSKPVTTGEIYLPYPNPAEVDVSIGGIKPTKGEGNVGEVTVNNAEPEIKLTSNQKVKMIYKIDGKYKVDEDNNIIEYEINNNTPLVLKEELAEGGNNLEFYFVNNQGDYTTEKICISVDTEPPTLMLNNTIVESENGKYVITGVSEVDSVVYVGNDEAVVSNGSFNYIGNGNNSREEVAVVAVDCAGNKTVMLCEVIPSELSKFKSIKIKADNKEVNEKLEIEKGSAVSISVYGIGEDGKEYLLDNSNVNYSIVYGNDKISIVDGVLRGDYYGEGVLLCEYKVTDNYSFEETLPVTVLNLNIAPTTIRVSNTEILSSSSIGTIVSYISVPQAPIGVSYKYSVEDNDYLEVKDNTLVLKSQVDKVNGFTVKIKAQGQHVLNGVYEEIFDPIETDVTFKVINSIVSVEPLDSILVEKGTDFDNLNLPKTAKVTLSNNIVKELPITWSKGAYNSSIARVYTLKASIEKDEGIINPQDIEVSIQVSVNKLNINKPQTGVYSYGYTLPVESKPLTITNEGTTDLTISNVEVFDINGGKSGQLTASLINKTIPAGTTTEFAYISPVTGLKVGNYKAKVVVTYGNGFKAEENVGVIIEPAKVSINYDGQKVSYDGNPHEANVVVYDKSNSITLSKDKYNVIYTKDGNSSYQAPAEVGEYLVTVELTDENYVIENDIVNKSLTIYKNSGSKKKPKNENKKDDSEIEEPTEKQEPTGIEKIFTDVSNHWAKDSIAYVYEKGLFSGVSDNTFAPNATMTRGMVATVLSRLSKEDMSKYTNSSFNDVPSHMWYSKGIAWATESNIAKGISDKEFRPDDSITREQLVVMIKNFANYMGIDTSANENLDLYEDADKISSWSMDSIKWAVSEGIISGKGDNILDPQGTATRAEVATILMRFIEKFLNM